MKVIRLWELLSKTHSGHYIHYAYVANRAAANEWQKQRWPYDYSVEKKQIVVLDDLKDLENYNKKMIREKALAKLSPEEREILGL